MAEKVRYPQIPSTVWWGVRSILNKTPNATLDDRFLSVELGVQPVAAKQYIAELVSVGILSEELKATPLAKKWRLDASYSEAVDELIRKVYPEGLIHLAPPGSGDRQKAVSWFQQEGLGQGAAGNKAATYLMLGSKLPNEAPGRTAGGRTAKDEQKATLREGKAKAAKQTSTGSSKPKGSGSGNGATGSSEIPLNVNVQIHISADATSEQIESIFAAMRRYLYDKTTS